MRFKNIENNEIVSIKRKGKLFVIQFVEKRAEAMKSKDWHWKEIIGLNNYSFVIKNTEENRKDISDNYRLV